MSSRTVREATWLESDRWLALALARHEASLCRCGQPRDRAWNPDMGGWYDPEAHECQACSAKANLEIGRGAESYTYVSVAEQPGAPKVLRPML